MQEKESRGGGIRSHIKYIAAKWKNCGKQEMNMQKRAGKGYEKCK